MLIYRDEAAANKLSDLLMHEGTGLSVKAGTPLDAMLSSMDPLQQTSLVDATTAEPFKSNHDSSQNTAISMAYDRLMANRNFAKNTINPIIRDIAEQCEVTRQQVERDNDLFAMDIAVIEPLRIFASSRLEEMFTPYANAQFVSFQESDTLSRIRSDFDIDRFLKAVTSQNDQWNSAITRMLQCAGNDASATIALIGSTQRVADILPQSVTMFRSPLAVVNFLYVDAIIGGMYETDQQYDQSELARIKGWYGMQVNRQVNNIRDFNQNRYLLLSGSDDRTLYVYNRRWDGLSALLPPKMLIGLYMANNSSITVTNQILSRSDAEITAAMDSIAANIASREQSNNFRVKLEEVSKLRQVIQMAIIGYINDESIVNVEDRDQLFSVAQGYWKHNTLSSDEDVLDFIRRAVCGIIGHGTSAYQLLADIDTYLNNNPDASVEKADIYASSRILVKWLMNQTDVVSVATTTQLLRNAI